MSNTENNKKSLKQQATERLAAIALVERKAEVLKLTREVGPVGARQQDLLNQIDETLLRIIAENTDVVEEENEDGDMDLVEVVALDENTQDLIKVAATLSQLLREAWTYS